jgi:hypothetical protein
MGGEGKGGRWEGGIIVLWLPPSILKKSGVADGNSRSDGSYPLLIRRRFEVLFALLPEDRRYQFAA